jgi:hypothetical protein
MRLQRIALASLCVPGQRGAIRMEPDFGSTLCFPVSSVVKEL